MSRLKFYISCPISEPIERLRSVIDYLTGLGIEAIAWRRGSPYNHKSTVDNCYGFVLMLPGNLCNIPRRHLPNGCRLELERAIHQNRSLYIAHTNSKEEVCIYDMTRRDYIIGAVSEQKDSDILKNNVLPEKAFDSSSKNKLDKRLLLL